jgi:hypothetical protein
MSDDELEFSDLEENSDYDLEDEDDEGAKLDSSKEQLKSSGSSSSITGLRHLNELKQRLGKCGLLCNS